VLVSYFAGALIAPVGGSHLAPVQVNPKQAKLQQKSVTPKEERTSVINCFNITKSQVIIHRMKMKLKKLFLIMIIITEEG
jgi:hypothetical protein